MHGYGVYTIYNEVCKMYSFNLSVLDTFIFVAWIDKWCQNVLEGRLRFRMHITKHKLHYASFLLSKDR